MSDDDGGGHGSPFMNKDGSITAPSYMLLLGLALLVSSRYWLGGGLILLGIILAICMSPMVEQEDKLEIQFRIWNAVDVLMELERVENSEDVEEEERRLHVQMALESLIEKYSKHAHSQKEQRRRHDAEQQGKRGKRGQQFPQRPASQYRPHELECICQDAVYCAFRLFPNNDTILTNAFGLHALVAKDGQVRKRHLYEADMYGLNSPIDCMNAALKRAKGYREESKEQVAAELLRKASLLLGALGDGDSDVARQLVQEGALSALSNILDWYRYHEDCCNWALWALFILCLDNPHHKRLLHKEVNGIPIVCQTLRCNDESLEVTRHGVAILFDMMRQDNDRKTDESQLAQIRQVAIQEGLHRALLTAMDFFPDSMEIMGMGTEILLATGYQGDIPQYQPTS